MKRRDAGFTLLEVMVALAILALALTFISQAQQASMRQVLRAKMMTVATFLAREKMVEVEDELFEEGFKDFEEEEKGDFAEEGFKNYRWVMKIEKIELPTDVNPSDALNAADTSGAGGSPMGTGLGMLGGSMLGAQFEMFRNIIEESIRRVSLSVEWDEGKKERSISVVAYFTDPRKIESMAGALNALTSKTSTTSSKNTSTSNTKTNLKSMTTTTR